MSQSSSLFSALFDHSWAFSHSLQPRPIHTHTHTHTHTHRGLSSRTNTAGVVWGVRSSTGMPLVLFTHLSPSYFGCRVGETRLEGCNAHKIGIPSNFEGFNSRYQWSVSQANTSVFTKDKQKADLFSGPLYFSPLALCRNPGFSHLTSKYCVNTAQSII